MCNDDDDMRDLMNWFAERDEGPTMIMMRLMMRGWGAGCGCRVWGWGLSIRVGMVG